MAKNKKVVKYKKPFHLNIGIVIFVFIFIYLVFNVFSYMTTDHISVYEVEQGTMASNNIYNGLVLRDEKIYYAQNTGALNYYVKEASKVSYGNLICSIDETGDVSERIDAATLDSGALDTEYLSDIEESILGFQTSYDGQAFYKVYNFKDDLASTLNEALSVGALNQISDYAQSASEKNTFHRISSDSAGIVVFYTDGYEEVTTENFTEDMFHAADYRKTNLKTLSYVQSGEPVYKLINSETWNIIIPVSESLAGSIADEDVIEIRFVKDNKKIYAYSELIQKSGQYYAILTLHSSMVRYAKERYVEVELLLSEESGLKIPNSSITEKEFFTVPSDYFMQGGDSSDRGILVQRINDSGESTAEFVIPTIYYETDDYCYIDSEEVSAGEVILKADSREQYIIGTETASLQGVYNINKGYAVFKQIDVLYKNEEYTLVKTATKYGISLYDHIALDASKVNENELLK